MTRAAMTALALVALVAAVPQETAPATAAAPNAFLRLGVDGDIDAKATREKWIRDRFPVWHGWIPLESFSFGGRATPTAATRVMTATRTPDDASPILMRAAEARAPIREAVLVVRRAGGFDFYRIEDLQVVSHRRGAGDLPQEEVAFVFIAIKHVQ